MTRRDFLALATLPVIAGVEVDSGAAPLIVYYSGLAIEVEGGILVTRTRRTVLDFPSGPVVIPARVVYQFEGYVDLRANAHVLHPLAIELAQAHQDRARDRQDPAWYHDAAVDHLITAAEGMLKLPGEPARKVQSHGGVQLTDYWDWDRRENRRRKDVMFARIDCVHRLPAPDA